MIAGSPQITAIIPTYRRAQRLERAIRSVLNQTYPHLLVCVCDDASGDDTADVVQALAAEDPRVRYFCQPKNLGKLGNFQFGMDRLETPYFTILSDDDVFLPHLFADAVEALEAHPDAGLFAGSSVSIDEASGDAVYAPLHFWPRDGRYDVASQPPVPSLWMYPYWPGTILRTSVIAQVGALDPTVPQVDLDYNLRVAARFPMVISKKPSAIFVLQPTSAFQLAALDDYWPACRKIRENIERDDQIPADVQSRLRVLIDHSAAELFAREARKYLQQRNYRDAERAADILQDEYHLHGRAARLRLAIRLCQRSSWFRAAYTSALGAYHFLDRRIGQRSRMKAAYSEAANWLRLAASSSKSSQSIEV